MRLLFNPANQIFFKKAQNDRMKGAIEVSNPTADTIFAFKIKCTNPDLFSVTPLKGLIKAGQKINIQFGTNDPVSLDYARQLMSKHKFLIEFVPITSELSIPNFKSQQSDRKKYYINMDSIRGAKLFKDNEKMSIHSAISNRQSYISMKNQDQRPVRDNQHNTPRKFDEPKLMPQSPSKNNHEDLHEKYSALKTQLQDLHRQRQQIINQMSSTRKSSKNNIKKLIIFIIFLVIGVFLGNGIQKFIENKRIQAEQERKKQQESKPWRFFGILDFLYDQVDPDDL